MVCYCCLICVLSNLYRIYILKISIVKIFNLVKIFRVMIYFWLVLNLVLNRFLFLDGGKILVIFLL